MSCETHLFPFRSTSSLNFPKHVSWDLPSLIGLTDEVGYLGIVVRNLNGEVEKEGQMQKEV